MTLLERMARAYREECKRLDIECTRSDAEVMEYMRAISESESPLGPAGMVALAVLREEQAPKCSTCLGMGLVFRNPSALEAVPCPACMPLAAPPPPCATCDGTRNVLVRGKINPCPACARGAR